MPSALLEISSSARIAASGSGSRQSTHAGSARSRRSYTRWKLLRLQIASSPVLYRCSRAILASSQFHQVPGCFLRGADVRRPDRPFRLDPRQHRAQQPAVLRGVGPAPPPAGSSLGVAAHRRHRQTVMRQRNDAGGVHPVLEQTPPVVQRRAAAVEQQAVQVGRVVGPQSAPQGQILRPPHHLQGVDLQPADLLDGSVHVIGSRSRAAPQRFAQHLRMQAPGRAPPAVDTRLPIGSCLCS